MIRIWSLTPVSWIGMAGMVFVRLWFPGSACCRQPLHTCVMSGYICPLSVSLSPQEHKRYWTSLIGDTLFFFNNSRDTTYVEKLCLSGFLSLTDDNSRDKNLEAGRLTLKMRDGEFRLTLAVPHSLTLLPGQIHRLQEVLSEEEKRHRKQEESAAPPAVSPANCTEQETDLPSCFIEKTDRTLVPFILQEDYEHSISFVQSDRDSGEDTVQRARAISTPKPPLPPKKPGIPSPRASLPTLYTEPEPVPEPEPEENFYLNDYSPLKPPVCLKPKPSQRPPSESTATVKPLLPQQSQPNEVLLHSVTEELREKLLQRRGNLS
ncbi:UNVERIFIED_CONTAM: hypothetical protein FKN15_015752 [Acipenser sinensis]